MTPEDEQELAHTLLIELIAHQFCYPVRWIETQDCFFAEKGVERLVEIGPTPTLTNMGKHTIASKYREHDDANAITRKCLSTKLHSNEIYYQAEPVQEQAVADQSRSASTEAVASNTPATPSRAVPEPLPPQQTTPLVEVAEAVADSPIGVADILRSLITVRLRKQDGTLPPLTASIKDLCGGRSALQNEIIGDLGKEFGSLPESLEDTPLGDLSDQLQLSFNGQLGSVSRSLIGRMVATKLPGGFSMTTVRDYLEKRWRLASGRQDGVLLVALTGQPTSRITADKDGEAFLDTAVAKYASAAGISLSPSVAASSQGGQIKAAYIDEETFASLRKSQDTLSQALLKACAESLEVDLSKDARRIDQLEKAITGYQSELELISVEHGESYVAGIQPQFKSVQLRRFDSYWSWVKQDYLDMAHAVMRGAIEPEDISKRGRMITNRATEDLLQIMSWFTRVATARGIGDPIVQRLEEMLKDCQRALSAPPKVLLPSWTRPETVVSAEGSPSYSEVPRDSDFDVNAYITEMLAPAARHRVSRDTDADRTAKTTGACETSSSKNAWQYVAPQNAAEDLPTHPYIHIQRRGRHSTWEYSAVDTGRYLESLRQGLTFQSPAPAHVLLTGAGRNSIALDVLKGLLNGGARVLVTTSSFSPDVARFYQRIYHEHGARGSQLLLAPFNQGSRQDVEALVNHIYATDDGGLGWDLDYILPFAAVSENGRDIDGLDGRSELAHRIMLTGTLRMLGAVKRHKARRGITTRPAHVVLPLSPNHGAFGHDGLYAESKLALEALLDKWGSEGWAEYLSICGASIGWTRGTGLMSDNDLVAAGIEQCGVRTFSRQEMAFSVLGLLAPAVRDACQEAPLRANLDGGLGGLADLNALVGRARAALNGACDERRAVALDAARDAAVAGQAAPAPRPGSVVEPRGGAGFRGPRLPDWEGEIRPLSRELQGMVDLDRVVVVAGYSELGPLGNARTRWEMEAEGAFSVAGCVEMAWMMGLIKHHNGPLHGKPYCGWVDAATNAPLAEREVKQKHEAHILAHSGIRLADTGAGPVLHEVVVQHDLEPFEAPRETAEDFKRAHGDKVDIAAVPGSSEFRVRLRRGAVLRVPKAAQPGRRAEGQLPAGWDARAYGIADDVVSQTDPVTLYLLACTAEALLSAGVRDPYEFYQHIHVSEAANCIGTAIGPVRSAKAMLSGRGANESVQDDILQETFHNTPAAWINLLLLSAAGPIKTPVGACATSLESLQSGFESIASGRARMCLVGGYDDLHADVAAEFRNMRATVDAEAELRRGRAPGDMSRPTAASRAGFVEAAGAGVQVLTSARLALDMGLPVYGVVALVELAADKAGRSVPAPGVGLLTAAREAPAPPPSTLSLAYRRRRLELRHAQIDEWQRAELEGLHGEMASLRKLYHIADAPAYLRARVHEVSLEAAQQRRAALASYGNFFWKGDARISPLRGALAVWGLTVDDLTVASLHGTSTRKNDANESRIVHEQLRLLGRSPGNPVLAVCQKHLTGHSKGAAGAWMINGCLQMLDSGFVPGNANADNVDPELEQYANIAFVDAGVQTAGVKAFSATSFGFGQKAGQCIGVHPKYLFATLERDDFDRYRAKTELRMRQAAKAFANSLVNNDMFRAKDRPPYSAEAEVAVLTDPTVRAALDADGEYAVTLDAAVHF
ncbi:hypothetical protein B0J12DRAFT_629554 [Macrophomina phaseolina]|uniref:beta-ketoacyl-[acyl-carrier-protein] synthase I n=1 Tax=Macrophomina phaseolina TaxID=35725 RepID=A0ABQ8G5E3_9PEZI|nr:hypothetical protein B0J12DRAFT_629554 [Macrophomina phaseolina]